MFGPLPGYELSWPQALHRQQNLAGKNERDG